MKKLTHLLTFILALCLCLALSACDKQRDTDTSAETCVHEDVELNGICDKCEAVVGEAHTVCLDENGDGVCDVCGKAVPKPECEHTYDNSCDANCNLCGRERQVTHSYTNDCDTDCNLCSKERQVTHSYTNNCDTNCNLCSKERQVAHSYTNGCDTDCNLCSKERQVAHSYTNGCDTDCNLCGEERQTTHVYDSDIDTECNECGELREVPGQPIKDNTFIYLLKQDLSAYTIIGLVNQNLSSVTIPDVFRGKPVTDISASAFHRYSNLTEIKVDAKNTSFKSSDGILYSKDGKTLICYPNAKPISLFFTVPDDVEKIGNYAFASRNREKTTFVILSSSVIEIGDYAFMDCEAFSFSVVDNSNLQIIGKSAFMGSELYNITIPESVAYIGDLAFADCSKLKSITVDENNESYKSIDGVLYSRDGKELICFPLSKQTDEIIIPDGVEIISHSACAGFREYVETITIPDSVKIIEAYAFYQIPNLREVVISENSNLEFIEENAFALCSDLQSIATLSKRVAYVGPNAFAGCDILTVYCQAQSKPESWDTEWDNSVLIVIWNHNP